MKLYKISQDVNEGYETYDSAIVAAENEEQARLISPAGCFNGVGSSTWCNSPNEVEVELIGYAKAKTKAGLVLGSFNAG